MKRLLLIILLIPQLAYSQYQSSCFQPNRNNNIETSPVGVSIDADTTILLNRTSAISGFVVTGEATLDNFNDSYIRITLKDSYNYEFLVYENYPMLSGRLSSAFANFAMETIVLNDITPQILKVEIHNAVLQLDSYGCISASISSRGQESSPEALQREQTQYLVDRLNSNLKQHNKTWRAGITSVSLKSYEEKKAMFGGRVPKLYGFEHYAGGIFVLPSCNVETNGTIQNRTSSQYVSEWDWRNRHGKNWMTSVKDQGGCGSCWAHAAVGALEAYINLYYNDNTLNYDLSEKEMTSCNSLGSGCYGGNESHVYDYVKMYGIVSEECLPYLIPYVNDCDRCDNPQERISIEDYKFYEKYYHTDNIEEDSIKKHLLKSPTTIGIESWGHIMALAGFKTIAAGDTIYDIYSGGHNDTIVVDPTNHAYLIGSPAWLVKNSWGTDWGNQGYGYLFVSSIDIMTHSYIQGRITSQVLTDNDIICSDADGDGLYFWGLGPKPSNCPSWVPDTPDGDDSDINYGALDSLGVLQSLPAGITINVFEQYVTDYSTSSYQYGIVNGGTFAVYGELTLTGNGKIRVCEGGTLLVEGGILNNADIVMLPGSQLIVRDGGIINMAPGKELLAPKGAIVNIEEGEINNYSGS